MATIQPVPILRTEEAAAALGVTGRTMLRYIEHGRVRSFQTLGGHHRIPRPEVDRLQEECALRTP